LTGVTGQEAGSGSATFTLERFEWSDEGRIELAGVWNGVPGDTFARPALLMDVEGKSRRVAALMDHKPWSAQEGERWEAAFKWEEEPAAIESVRLRVASGIELELPPPVFAEEERAAAPLKRLPERAAASDDAAEGTAVMDAEPGEDVFDRLADAESRAAVLQRERDEAVAGRRATAKQLEELRHAHERALNDARADERAKATAALAEGAEVRVVLERQRDEAHAVRDAAVSARAAAEAAKAEALEQRKHALAERKQAEKDRAIALRERDRALREASEALAARERAFQERDQAIAERDAAYNERDGVLNAYERGLPPKPPQPRFLPEEPERDELDMWMGRAVAGLIVLVFLVVLLQFFL